MPEAAYTAFVSMDLIGYTIFINVSDHILRFFLRIIHFLSAGKLKRRYLFYFWFVAHGPVISNR